MSCCVRHCVCTAPAQRAPCKGSCVANPAEGAALGSTWRVRRKQVVERLLAGPVLQASHSEDVGGGFRVGHQHVRPGRALPPAPVASGAAPARAVRARRHCGMRPCGGGGTERTAQRSGAPAGGEFNCLPKLSAPQVAQAQSKPAARSAAGPRPKGEANWSLRACVP